MKNIILFLLFVLMSLQLSASEKQTSKMKGYLLKVNFSYRDQSQDFQLKSEIIVNENNQDWVPLSAGKGGIALIGKIHKANQGVFTTEYMIVNTAA